jgi:hypothetical protein
MRLSQILAIIWLLTPAIVGTAFLLRNVRWRFVKPFLIATIVGYAVLIAAARIRDFELNAELYELDTNGDGVFTSGEITPEVNKRLVAVASDTGRTLAPFTGLPLSAIWSAVNFAAIALCAKVSTVVKQLCQTNRST